MTSETAIKKEIVAYLDSLGSACYHFPVHNMGYGRRGIPDRIICYKGYFLAPEIKRPPEKRRKSPEAEKWQEREIGAILDAGGWAGVIWSVTQMRSIIRSIDHRIEMRAVTRMPF